MDNQKWWKNMTDGKSDKKSFGDAPKKIGKIAVTALVIAVAAILLLSSVYTVNDKQQAVVTTFGKVTAVTDPGIHFKLPFGIQKATHVDVNVYRKIELGYRSTPENGYVSQAVPEYPYGAKADSVTVASESKMRLFRGIQNLRPRKISLQFPKSRRDT